MPTYKEVRERVSQIRMRLAGGWMPFVGHLLMKLEFYEATPATGVKTAGVTRDGKCFLNVEFCDSLSDPELSFLLAHEVMHVALLCFQRQGERKAMGVTASGQRVSFWNCAHDYAINLILTEMIASSPEYKGKIVMPPHGLLDPKYSGWSAEEIYDDLISKAKPLPDDVMIDMRDDLGGKGKGKSDDDKGEKPKPNPKGDKDKGNKGDKGDKSDDPGSKTGSEPGSDGDDEDDDIFDGPGDRSDIENRQLDEDWQVNVLEAAEVHKQQKKGDLPGALQQIIDEIKNPKIWWADALSRWVGANGRKVNFSYRRPSRRSHAVGEILPHQVRDGLDRLVVLWDTSGSMADRQTEIMSELVGIADDMRMVLRVMCCDAVVHFDQEISDPSEVAPVGGGGSDLTPAFQRLEEEAFDGVVVAFTDGIITVPTEQPPNLRGALWCLWKLRGDVDPTGGRWGEVLNIEEDGNLKKKE